MGHNEKKKWEVPNKIEEGGRIWKTMNAWSLTEWETTGGNNNMRNWEKVGESVSSYEKTDVKDKNYKTQAEWIGGVGLRKTKW